MDDIVARSMSDLEILLYDMVYVHELSDEEITKKLVPVKPQNVELFVFVQKQIQHVRDNPKCPICNVILNHFSGDQHFTERLYCPTCNRQYQLEFPYEPIVGGDA